ncbi:endonuclease [Sphingomonas metalli]|uniref:Endonuclease n=2 Tax=Sphingomonas metalli TaxID=1779358 RepID=A0A916WS30_9SPHN|nr:endonuclease [Sphingomonas metalli]
MPGRRAVLGGLAALALGARATARAKPPELTVMSFNVRLPLASDGTNDWPHRRALMIDTIRRADPDLIGTQELFKIQGDEIVAALPHYRWFGRDRRGGQADEHMGIFYHSGRWLVEESGDFWLSDTPDVPGSISWGNVYPRMAAWARFRRVGGEERVTLFDTHLPYRIDDEAARVRGARMIAQRIAAVQGPIVLTGDFNAEPSTPPHQVLATSLTDVWQVAPRKKGPAATFHAFTGKPTQRIDWIWTRGLIPLRVTVIDAHQGALYPSDHFPVLAQLSWPLPKT